MAEWPCCHDPLRFSPLSLRFVPPPIRLFVFLFTQSKSGVQRSATTILDHSRGTFNLLPCLVKILSMINIESPSIRIQSSATPAELGFLCLVKTLSGDDFKSTSGAGASHNIAEVQGPRVRKSKALGCGSPAHHGGVSGPWVREPRSPSGGCRPWGAGASVAIGRLQAASVAIDRKAGPRVRKPRTPSGDFGAGSSVTIGRNKAPGCGSLRDHRATLGPSVREPRYHRSN